MSEFPEPFTPLRRTSRSRLVVLYLVGPLLWVAAIVVVGLLVHEQDAVEIGLLIATAAFVVGILLLVPQRMLRIRRENEGEKLR